MKHGQKIKTLGREKAPREMMLRNLVASILIYEKVETTQAKAKAVKALVDKMITMAKKKTLASQRALIQFLPQKMAVKKSVEVLGERYKDRQGGYTRIIKIDARKGDGAEMAIIELV